jgi:SpoVK/Ycf46/Vps4 family AAA+-type ATPase
MGISEVINHAVKASNVDNNHPRKNREIVTYSAVTEKSINKESENDFLTAAYERIILISEAVLSMNYQRQKIGFEDQLKMSVDNHKDNIDISHDKIPWDGVHSILICADEGAGKSYLLNKIEKSIITLRNQGQSMKIQKDGCNIRILRLSGADCDYRKGSSPSSSSSDFNNRVSTDLSTLDKDFFNIRYHLQWLIRLFAVDGEVYNDGLFDTNIEHGGIRILLLIDDLDSILLSSTGDEESNDNSDKESLSATAGYHLRQLLYAIAVPSNNLIDRVMIIGTTRASPSTLPRAHTGAPEFETVVTLPRPTWKDRKSMLKIMMKDCNIALESLDPIQNATLNNDIGYDRNLDLYTEENNEKIKENNLNKIVLNDGKIEENFLVWVMRIADLTAGFLPGDLASIIRRAKGLYMGQQKVFPASNSSHDISAKSAFSWKSMLAVISSLPPKQLQKLDSLVTTGSSAGELLSWDDFCGYEEVKITLKRLLKLSTIHRTDNDLVEGDSVSHSVSTSSVRTSPTSTTVPDIMTITDRGQKNECTMTLRESLKVSSDKVRGIVLYGPSGCGKSFLARIIATEANMNFVSVRSTDLLSKYFGQTEASIRNLFKRVRAAAPCALFFDEFDALAYKRGLVDEDGGGGGSLQTRVLSTFLNELDGIVSQDTGVEGGILVLAACTDINVLDDALLRPGRLQHHIELELPSLINIEAILQGRIDKLKCGDDVSVKILAGILSGLGRNISGADVENVCRRALIARIREESCNNTCNHDKDINISISNFYEALNECYPPTSLSLILPPPLVDSSPFVM